MRAAEVLGPDGPLAAALDGYELRESQLRMATMVEDSLAHDGVALIEAGTGTGKTLAYLVPALRSGRRVVVSTGTRNLQDQIMERDLPFLARHLGVPVRAAAMKGLSNYLCRRRYQQLIESPAAFRPSIAPRLPVLTDWVASTDRGDLAELTTLAEEDPLRLAVQSGSETRIGPRCSHAEDCFVGAMRARASRAKLVVVNHHLFFADLVLRGAHGGGAHGGIIPDYDAVIFDEAHQLEDTATLFFGVRASGAALARLALDAERALGPGDRLAAGVRHRSEAFFDVVPERDGRVDLPEGFFEGGPGAAAYHALDAALEALHLGAERVDESESTSQIARRARRVRDELGQIATPASSHVRWSETSDRSRSVGASPVDVSSLFRDQVVSRVSSVVLTSATLTTGGSFDFVRQRLGIDFEVDEAALASPFDYASQAALYTPPLPDPRSPAYFDAAVSEIVRLAKLTRGGAFVLSTSVRMMRRFAARVRPQLRGRPIYVQGEAPKNALLDRFREDGDAVLFATMSFWEGVDVPGDALRLVIIDKLPFGVPTDPLVEARCRRMEEAGDKPFIRYVVPSAALTLKQGFGRLIRSTRDRGVVAVLDSRIATKGYGKVFLRSLPDATRCDSFEKLGRFLEEAHPDEMPIG